MDEFGLIDLITKDTPRSINELVRGIGDDCAVIEDAYMHRLITTDSLVEGIHFKMSYMSPHAIGRRSLNINLSDIAAMGGYPRFYTVGLALPKGLGVRRCLEIFMGMSEAAAKYQTILIGGDTVASPSSLTLSITVIGEVDKGKALLRSGARSGDAIYVTGTIGSAALGLQCLKTDLVSSETATFLKRYIDPLPRIEAGRWLKNTGMVTSMIDISDGLMADLGHIAHSSGTGYEVIMSDIPRDDGFNELSRKLKLRDIDLIAAGGDDYELAFTVAKDKIDRFEKLLHSENLPFIQEITRIGTMVEDKDRKTILDDSGDDLSIHRMGYNHLEATG